MERRNDGKKENIEDQYTTEITQGSNTCYTTEITEKSNTCHTTEITQGSNT